MNKIFENKNNKNIGEKKMENNRKVVKENLNITKEKPDMKYILEYSPVVLTTKNNLLEVGKIDHAIIFKYKIQKGIDNKKYRVYYPEVIPIKDILSNISNPNLTLQIREENEKWLREFLNELPRVEDIERKEVLNLIYQNSIHGVKILKDTIMYTNNDRHFVSTDKGIRNVSKGELMAYSILKAYQFFVKKYEKENKILIPTLKLGPEKVIYFAESDIVLDIIKERDLLEEFKGITTPQKAFQRLHKFLSPLTELPHAEVYVSDTDNILGIPKYKRNPKQSLTEGVLLVTKTYADKANLVEGAKFSYTLKSLTHIVEDSVLFIDGKQYDVALSMDENKWKVEASKLGNILKAFTDKTPDVNARLFKIVEFKANNMFFTRMENNLREETKENLQTIQKILKNQSELEKILTKDKKSFKPRYEKFLFDILSIDLFNKEEKTEYDGLEREMHPTLTDLGYKILNKDLATDITYKENGQIYKNVKGPWLINSADRKPELNKQLYPRLGKAVAKLLTHDVVYSKFVGCSGTVLPMNMKPEDSYPVAYNVTDENRVLYSNKLSMFEKIEQIEFIRERNAKLAELGIGQDLIYVQRHPSMLGVWTKLFYSPSTKLFYVDEELWNVFFGGDFDGDNFVGLYPYHPLNKELNNLNGNIIDPIDNKRMIALIDTNPEIKKLLVEGLFNKINGLRARFTSDNKIAEDIKIINDITAKITSMNPKYKYVEKKYNKFFINKEYQNWADAQDGKEIVGKIHSIVCNALTFFVQNLRVEEDLKFSTYFIYFHIQPAIEGLKQDEEGKIPNIKDLLIEMVFVFKEMFGEERLKKLHIPTIEEVNEHKLIYSKVRNFETIGLLNKDKDEYVYDDLFYKKEKLMEIAKKIKTPWTNKYRKLIKLAEKYYPLAKSQNPTNPPTSPEPTDPETKNTDVMIPTKEEKKMDTSIVDKKVNEIMKEHIDLIKHNKWDENDIKNRILDVEDNLMSDKDIEEMLMNEYEELRKEEVMAEILPLTLQAVKEELSQYNVDTIRKPTKDGYGKERWGEYRDLSPRIKREFFSDTSTLKWDEAEGYIQAVKGDKFDLFEYLRVIDMKIPVGINNKKQKKEKKMKTTTNEVKIQKQEDKTMNKKITSVSSTSEQKVESKIVIYTDGSYNTKTNVGSWAYVMLKDKVKIHEASGKTKENFLVSRNIAGECTAVLKALQYCDANNITKVEIHHDLEGVQKWAKPINGEKRWKATTEITKVYQTWFDKYTKKINVDFVHVKGHSGETWNEYVDELAGKISGTKNTQLASSTPLQKTEIKTSYYAGIGNRETPQEILELMEKIGKKLAQNGVILRSGHAIGADQAFEKGCDSVKGKKEIFIANDAKNDKAALDLAASIHPAWDKCSEYAQLLHARNGYIILGKNLNTPVDFVICYQDESRKFGGTRQGMKLAQLKGIKVYNLWKPNVRKAIEERLASLNK